MLSALLGIASQGICHDRVRRPVTRFIDFYQAAEQTPMSLIERIAYGLAVASHGG
jgi:hypothetical protein